MAASPALRGLDAFAAEVRRTLSAPEPDQVHDLRVSIRRLLQVLALYDGSVKPIPLVLKKIMRFAGDVRNCDITLKLVAKDNPSKGLLKRLRRRRGSSERTLILELQKWIEMDSASKWKAKLASSTIADSVDTSIRQALKRLFKRGAAAEDSDKKLHPLRIAAKKLRYSLDLAESADPARVELIVQLQRRLGDINDYATAQEIAREESAPSRVIKGLRRQEGRKIKSFRRFWDREFAGKKRRREWKDKTFRGTRSMTVAPESQTAAVMKHA